MTDCRRNPLVRGLLDRDAVEDDGAAVEDATEALRKLRARQLPDALEELDASDALEELDAADALEEPDGTDAS